MSGTARYPEIDILRGIAILMMILFHTIFDLTFFRIMPFDVENGFWRFFAYATASLFLLIVGISLSISHARASSRLQGRAMVQKFLFRAPGSSAAVFWLRSGPGGTCRKGMSSSASFTSSELR